MDQNESLSHFINRLSIVLVSRETVEGDPKDNPPNSDPWSFERCLHYCPVKQFWFRSKSLFGREISMMASLNDLNLISAFRGLTLSRTTAKEITLEPRSNRVCSTHQLSFSQRIQSLRGALWWQQECALVLLLGSVSHHGFRPAYISRELARHRSMSRGATAQTLSCRFQWPSETFYSGQRQRESRLAHLPRLRPKSDSDRPSALCSLRVGPSAGRDCLRLRCDHHRSLSFALPLGQIPQAQRRDQAAYVAGDPQRHPSVYSYYRRLRARCQSPRRARPRARFIHCIGPRLPRLRAPLSLPHGLGLLRYSRQRQSDIPAALFSFARPRDRHPQRSNHRLDWTKNGDALSQPAASRALLRCGNRSATSPLNQQLLHPCADGRRALSLPLADRTLLQMDQTTSAHQKLFPHFGQLRQDPSLDRRGRLRARSYCQKTPGTQTRSLHNSTDLESHPFRENVHFKPLPTLG